MRADFRLMKDLAEIVHTNADRKVKECQNLFEVFKANPVQLKGYKYKAGNMVMGAKGSGERNSFDIEACARDIDRKIQDKMYE